MKNHTDNVHAIKSNAKENNSERRSMTASGRQIFFTPNFNKAHAKFLNRNGSESPASDESDTDIIVTCNKCEKEFNTESNLRSHMKTHSKKFECDVCQVKVISKDAMNSHKMNSHEYITPCTVCGEELRNTASLQVHILTKHCTQSDTIINMLKKQEQTMLVMQCQINQLTYKMSVSSVRPGPLPPAPWLSLLPPSQWLPGPQPPLLGPPSRLVTQNRSETFVMLVTVLHTTL